MDHGSAEIFNAHLCGSGIPSDAFCFVRSFLPPPPPPPPRSFPLLSFFLLSCLSLGDWMSLSIWPFWENKRESDDEDDDDEDDDDDVE